MTYSGSNLGINLDKNLTGLYVILANTFLAEMKSLKVLPRILRTRNSVKFSRVYWALVGFPL